MRDRLDQFRPVAVPRQTDAEISVLGHVMGVPGAEFVEDIAAEKERGAAKRDDKAKAGEAGQDEAEPAGIFDGETAA